MNPGEESICFNPGEKKQKRKERKKKERDEKREGGTSSQNKIWNYFFIIKNKL